MIEPYGGKLVERIADESHAAKLIDEAKELPVLHPFIDQVYDAEKICTGAYSPLEGFMCREEFESVLSNERLPGGLPWTLPVFLAPSNREDEHTISVARPSDSLALSDGTGKIFAIFTLEEKFEYSRDALAKSVYGTTDRSHPNVADIANLSTTAAGGKVLLLRRLDHGGFEYTPRETRAHFEKMGWHSVAGYQARNPPHTAHEYIQRLTLEREDVDALLIQPIIGRLKKGDYRPDVIMRAYNAFVSSYYPGERVMLASLSITMRYAGPKAVLFYAIIRRNYGCSHYIIGRDQAGVGSFYDPYAAHRIFDRLDVGVVPLRYGETFFCRKCGVMASRKVCPHGDEFHESTSQTRIRKLLSEGKPLPSEILRPEVADILREGDVIGD